MSQLSRRQLALVVASAVPVLSPEPGEAQTTGSADKLAEAREGIQETAGKLAEFDLPMAVAPAFVFKP